MYSHTTIDNNFGGGGGKKLRCLGDVDGTINFVLTVKFVLFCFFERA